MTAYLLLVALAWGFATRGGTNLRDMLVVLLLLVGALAVDRARPPRWTAGIAAVMVLIGWLLLAGALRAGFTLESVRLPMLVVMATMSVLVAGRFGDDDRETFLQGLVVIGCLHAAVALAEGLVTATQGWSTPPRAASLLGSPNGLGTLLVATSVLTARELDRHDHWLPKAALLLQVCALLSTGSRSAVLLGCAVLVGYAATRGGWRRRGLAALGVVATAGVLAWRAATEPPEQRLHVWMEAMNRIADRPVLGAGPLTAPYATSGPDARVTTHAHNEILQWGVEYGLVGLALGLAALLLALGSAREARRRDRWVLVAAAVLLAGGMTDFSLRIPALTVTVAALVTLGTVRRPTTLGGDRHTTHPHLRARST